MTIKLESVPRVTLTHTGAILLGFMLAVWCTKTNDSRHLNIKQKQGFTITLPAKNAHGIDIKSLTADTPLWIQRKHDSYINGPCIQKLEDIRVRPGVKLVQLSGAVNRFEKIGPLISEIHAGRAFITQAVEKTDLKTCNELPIVEYGSNG
jgi:hypothetical protein